MITTITFSVSLAVKYGVDAAIMFQYIHYWVKHNEALGQHYHDGRFWTFNTYDALAKEFGFWTVKQIRRIIDKLKTDELILTNEYNKMSTDRTTWYAVSDKGFQEYFTALSEDASRSQKGNRRSPNGQMTEAQSGDCNIPNGQVSDAQMVSSQVPERAEQYQNSYQDSYQDSYKQNISDPTSPSVQSVTQTKKVKRFVPPTEEEVRAYCDEKGYDINVTMFWNFYEANGWVQGKGKPIKDWKRCVVTWVQTQKERDKERNQVHTAQTETARKGIKWSD